jgi:hypothetical protein
MIYLFGSILKLVFCYLTFINAFILSNGQCILIALEKKKKIYDYVGWDIMPYKKDAVGM